ncbi:MAG TPA: hypothetical protein VGC79_03885 [Polyangiaceae bacterium]
MSVQTRRRDCSTCKEPRKLAGNIADNGIFACPTCKRKYERRNREGAAADRVLEGLLVVPERSAGARPPAASAKTCDPPSARVRRGFSDGEAQ